MSLRAIRRLLSSTPLKARNTYITTQTTSTYYQGMNQDYRWYRQDELTRKCITTNALFATANGFETVIEANNPDKHNIILKIHKINDILYYTLNDNPKNSLKIRKINNKSRQENNHKNH